MNREKFQILNDIIASLEGASDLELSAVRAALLHHSQPRPQPMFLSRYDGWQPMPSDPSQPRSEPRLWIGIPPRILQSVLLLGDRRQVNFVGSPRRRMLDARG